jgi:hypothetical protein
MTSKKIMTKNDDSDIIKEPLFFSFFIRKKYLLKRRKAPLSTHVVCTGTTKANPQRRNKQNPQRPKP